MEVADFKSVATWKQGRAKAAGEISVRISVQSAPRKKKNPALTRREYEDEDRRKKHTAITVGRSMSMSMEYEYEYEYEYGV